MRIRAPQPVSNSMADRRKAGAHRGRLARKGEAGAERGEGKAGGGEVAGTAAGAGVSGGSRGGRKEVAIESNTAPSSISSQRPKGARQAKKVEPISGGAGTEGARIQPSAVSGGGASGRELSSAAGDGPPLEPITEGEGLTGREAATPTASSPPFTV